MSIWSLTYQQSVFKRYHSDKHLSQLYLQDGCKNSLGIDMEQKYVTVTRCIGPYRISLNTHVAAANFNRYRYRSKQSEIRYWLNMLNDDR